MVLYDVIFLAISPTIYQYHLVYQLKLHGLVLVDVVIILNKKWMACFVKRYNLYSHTIFLVEKIFRFP